MIHLIGDILAYNFQQNEEIVFPVNFLMLLYLLLVFANFQFFISSGVTEDYTFLILEINCTHEISSGYM